MGKHISSPGSHTGGRRQQQPTNVKGVLAQLTMLEQKPKIEFEQATSSYSFRFSELSQPI
jgi:hypothetical protein